VIAIDDPKRHAWFPVRGREQVEADGFKRCCGCGRPRSAHRRAYDQKNGGLVDVATGRSSVP